MTVQYHLRAADETMAAVDKFAATAGMKREDVMRLVIGLGVRQLEVMMTYTDPLVPAAVGAARNARALERLVTKHNT